MFPTLFVILTVGALYWCPIRRWMNQWGAERDAHSSVRARSVRARLLTHAIEPAGFLMTRRMLLGLKERAEALGAASTEETRANQRPAA